MALADAVAEPLRPGGGVPPFRRPVRVTDRPLLVRPAARDSPISADGRGLPESRASGPGPPGRQAPAAAHPSQGSIATMSTTQATGVNPNLRALAEAGTSPWLDLLRRSMVESGELARMVAEDSLKGVTANPSIFEKAILDSDDYDEELQQLARDGLDAQDIYERLAIRDVQHACDALRGVWESAQGGDGFVSLEVAPDIAHDGDRTLTAARDFWKRVDRPNVMIKIPGTPEGVSAIEEAIYDGINVNVTLLFACEAYERSPRPTSAACSAG